MAGTPPGTVPLCSRGTRNRRSRRKPEAPDAERAGGPTRRTGPRSRGLAAAASAAAPEPVGGRTVSSLGRARSRRVTQVGPDATHSGARPGTGRQADGHLTGPGRCDLEYLPLGGRTG